MGKWDAGWEDTPEDLPSLVKNDGNETEPGSTPDAMNGETEAPSTEIVPTTAKALKPFAKIDSTKVEECLNGIKEITSIYTDLEKHLSTETEQTNRVYIESLRDIRIAHENSQAVIQQSYYEYMKVVEECNKEVELGKIDLEKAKLKHEQIMTILKNAKNAFDKGLENGLNTFKETRELSSELIKKLKKEKNIDKFQIYFEDFLKLDNAKIKLLEFIENLRIQLSSLPEA